MRVRAVQLATMKMFLQSSGRIKMEGRDGFMQLSMRIGATLGTLSGAADAIFSLHGFGADLCEDRRRLRLSISLRAV